MKYLSIVLLLTFGFSPTAFAGAPRDVIKYSVEGGVKVYRNELSPEQKMARLVRQTVFQAEQRAQAHKQAEAAQQQQALAAREAAFERGYANGRQQAQEEQARAAQYRRAPRSRYGRRYTTSYYGYGGYRRYYYRPAYHGPSRRRRH